MKKIPIVLLLLLLFTSTVTNTKARTFGQLKQELATEEANLNTSNEKKKLTEQQIKQVEASITANRTQIENITKEVQTLNTEIEQLNKSIEEKEEQIKAIINFSQISSGESEYMEYLFGAADFTDFIYRVAIAEQLSNYNSNLIEEYNKNIEENKKKTTELASKQTELQEQQKQLEQNLNELGDQLDSDTEEKQSIEDNIKYLKELVQVYEQRGCGDNEEISTCGKASLPTSTQFYRPLISGTVTSEFGGRGSSYHYGTDMSIYTGGEVNVYASGAGVVSGISWKTSCGGTMVFIHHKTANGSTYTTVYMHLHYVYVSTNQVVTADTVIGTMGGNTTNPNAPGYTPWDSYSCSTGAHTHFQVATGLYGVDYSAWSSLRAHSFNSRNFINLPAKGVWFSGRTTAY